MNISTEYRLLGELKRKLMTYEIIVLPEIYGSKDRVDNPK